MPIVPATYSQVPCPRIASVQRDSGLVKLALELTDGALVETVLIPMRTRGAVRDRLTLCLSTQVGCAMGCRFCATGRMGFVRDMTAEEIASQAAVVERELGRPDKLVFMGMGEPLDNLDGFIGAVELLTCSRRSGARPPMAWSAADMTLSTAGHVEGLERLAPRFPSKMTLAVSLNASSDATRSRIMPINRRWSMERLREVLVAFPLRNRILMVEYVVMAGLNDSPEDAEALAVWLEPFRAFVNLIALNPIASGAPDWLREPTAASIERMRLRLEGKGIAARRRASPGRRILAACGQLATSRS